MPDPFQTLLVLWEIKLLNFIRESNEEFSQKVQRDRIHVGE